MLSPTINQRAGLALHETLAYNWVGIAPDTSTGMRITFLRMGGELFAQRPWAGFGDQGIQAYLNEPRLAVFASAYTREFALNSGFHDELMTNAVRSGIWGVIATVAIFIVPFVIFCKAFRSVAPVRAANALLGLTFIMCQMVSAMSTEVLNLKFTASFYAILIACLCGSSILRHEQK
jgi:O-antigen ligase